MLTLFIVLWIVALGALFGVVLAATEGDDPLTRI